jgi:phosphoribosylamine--glycine ligase
MFISKEFGKAADEIVIEEFMDGEEASVFAICDGKDYLCLPAAQDHKRIGEGDSGKNTGGMGAYAPAKVVNDDVLTQVKKEIIEKVLFGMEKEAHPYKGVLYCGLMIKDNKAKVVEFNVRFGDPETQVILPLLDSDIVQLLLSSINGTIKDYPLQISSDFAMTVVLASGGYPDNYEKNKVISGLESVKNCEIIHCGTILKDKTFLTNGGRVLNVVAKASQAKDVAQLIYDDINRIHFDGMYFRRDIGHRILK